MIRIFGTVFAGLVGLAFGSFLNVCLTRWPAGESVVAPRSHCRNCARTLTWWENVPVLSWIALRGRCRTCGVWIGWRYAVVELAVGVLWAAAVWRLLTDLAAWRCLSLTLNSNISWACFYDPLIGTIGLLLFYWLLVALAVFDADNLWLPDRLTLPGAAAGLVITAFGFRIAVALDSLSHSSSRYHFEYLHGEQWRMACYRLLAILAAASLILLIRWIYWVVRRREGIGIGDAKLMAMLAAWLGLPGTLLAFAIGVVLGAIVGVAMLLTPKLHPASQQPLALTKLPLGTFLCIGGIVSSLWGQPIIAAYMRWSGLL